MIPELAQQYPPRFHPHLELVVVQAGVEQEMGTMDEELLDRQHALLFDINRSIRYHTRRRAFFERLDMLTNMASLIFGSAAVYGVLEKDYATWALLSAALVTSLSGINLVVSSSRRAREHFDFARRFGDLAIKLQCDSLTDDLLRSATAERLRIEAEEPPILRMLDVQCYIEEARAQGLDYGGIELAWVQRVLSQLVDVGKVPAPAVSPS